MPRDFFPRPESRILSWSANFKNHILAAPGDYGLTAQQAADYAAVQETFAAAYQTAVNPSTNSASAVLAKNIARQALEALTRSLARIVRADPLVTAEMRFDLGLSLPPAGGGSPIVPPDAPPVLRVIGSMGRDVVVRLWDRNFPTRRGKPAGVSGAAPFAVVGEAPPARLARGSSRETPPAPPPGSSLTPPSRPARASG